MKKLFTILCALLIINPSIAQKIKYKDLFPELVNASVEETISKLKNYLVNDPEHAHANFKLALLYEKRYKNTDVLKTYEKAMANAEQARIRFLKAKEAVDEKEIRRNSNYYVDFASSFDNRGRPEISYKKVAEKIQHGYDSSLLLTDNLELIYKAFTSGVYHYDQAIKLFSNLNGSYKSLDEIYLMYDPELENKLNQLKGHYDSTLFYLDRYKHLINVYPINNYNQTYRVEPIITYRLDGLITQSNFLKNNISLWDYGKWADDIKHTVNTAIKELRHSIEKSELALQAGLVESAEANQLIELDKTLLFNLNKYDYQSLVASILEHKQFKQKIIDKKLSRNSYDTLGTVMKSGKYIFYSDLINLTKKADSIIKKIEIRLTNQKFKRHKKFFDTYYNGMAGLKAFVDTENMKNKAEFNRYVRALRNAIIDDLLTDTTRFAQQITYKNLNIPLHISKVSPDSTAYELVTSHRLKNTDGSLYVGGIQRTKSTINNLVAYVARLSPERNVSWFKTFDLPVDSTISDANNSIATMTLTQEGCALLLRSEHLHSQAAVNTLIYVTEKGEQKLSKRLSIDDYPRKINYNEIFNSFIITFKGETRYNNSATEEPLTMLNINVIGDILWKREFMMAGSIEEVVSIRNGYLVLGNYTTIKDHTGVWRRNEQVNAFALKIDLAGKLLKTLTIPSRRTYHISKVVKVNDGNINLFGYEDEPKPGFIDYADNLTHVIINADLALISSSLQ